MNYSFKCSIVKVEVLVYDDNTNNPIKGASVVNNNHSGLKFITGNEGRVCIDLPLNKCSAVYASKKPHRGRVSEVCTNHYKAGTKIFVKIPIKQYFVVEGKIYDKETGDPLSNVTVLLTPDLGKKTIKCRTDNNGRYSFLLKEHCYYSLNIIHEYFSIAMPKVYCTEGSKTGIFNHDIPLSREY